jgi:hypothetical protein
VWSIPINDISISAGARPLSVDVQRCTAGWPRTSQKNNALFLENLTLLVTLFVTVFVTLLFMLNFERDQKRD